MTAVRATVKFALDTGRLDPPTRPVEKAQHPSLILSLPTNKHLVASWRLLRLLTIGRRKFVESLPRRAYNPTYGYPSMLEVNEQRRQQATDHQSYILVPILSPRTTPSSLTC